MEDLIMQVGLLNDLKPWDVETKEMFISVLIFFLIKLEF